MEQTNLRVVVVVLMVVFVDYLLQADVEETKVRAVVFTNAESTTVSTVINIGDWPRSAAKPESLSPTTAGNCVRTADEEHHATYRRLLHLHYATAM